MDKESGGNFLHFIKILCGYRLPVENPFPDSEVKITVPGLDKKVLALSYWLISANAQ